MLSVLPYCVPLEHRCMRIKQLVVDAPSKNATSSISCLRCHRQTMWVHAAGKQAGMADRQMVS